MALDSGIPREHGGLVQVPLLGMRKMLLTQMVYTTKCAPSITYRLTRMEWP